jgi:hypothetical protein
MLCVFILWLCSKSKPYNPPLRNAKDIVINSELAVLPEKLCIIWTATRDLNQRKFYYPLNYRYGLNLQVNQKLSHVVLLILLAGDVATNPGPAYYSASTNSVSRKQVKCLVLNTRSIKSIHKDPASNITVCNLQRFQDLVYNENSDIICVSETWLTTDISNEEILHSGFTIYRKDRVNRCGGGVLIAVKTEHFKCQGICD